MSYQPGAELTAILRGPIRLMVAERAGEQRLTVTVATGPEDVTLIGELGVAAACGVANQLGYDLIEGQITQGVMATGDLVGVLQFRRSGPGDERPKEQVKNG